MIEFDIKNYGYYDSPHQTEPKFDPGESAPCLICGEPWTDDTVRTIGVMADDERSWFYRVHRECHNNLTPEQGRELDSLLIDRIPKNKPREGVDRLIEAVKETSSNGDSSESAGTSDVKE